jgi:adenylate cyclase
MQIKLTDGMKTKIYTRNIGAPETYYKFLVLREHINRWTKKDNIIARQLAEEIITMDPNWAMGYIMLASATVLDFQLGLNRDINECIKTAMELIEKAASLGSSFPNFHGVLSRIYLYQGEYEKAIEEVEKAIKLDPNFSNAYAWLARMYMLIGKPIEAMEMLNIGQRLQPKQVFHFYYWLGSVYCDLEQYESSIEALLTAIQLNPDQTVCRARLAVSYVLVDQLSYAEKQVEEILKIDPKYTIEGFELMNPYKNRSTLQRLTSSLKKAGLR